MSPINWGEHIIGYKEAGDILLRYALEKGRQNVLVYPVMFLYRHYIELQLKEIIINGRRYLGERRRFPLGHDINQLWQDCRSIVQAMDTNIEPNLTEEQRREFEDLYDNLGSYINILGELDPNSQTFRYPIDRDGNPIEIDFAAIYLKQLPELINRIDYSLAGIATGVYDILSDKEEWLSYG
ncbi:MAG: hypothetical protein COX14_00950 [Chloroflexi bacterium CG23_combo_of_CG06-09_8_20_14_all_45_10]|nr:MAG: hypothetical protein COX14_00950 [Chloroflexi bacterium CG23_combo_of_CG06-09_8_20_14_all_45_10]